MNPDEFLWTHYRMHQRHRRRDMGVRILILALIFGGLLLLAAIRVVQ